MKNGVSAFTHEAARDPKFYDMKARAEGIYGEMTNKEFIDKYYTTNLKDGSVGDTGVSVFSPALCEINYQWFTALGDRILDPFAGGSVRGVVASVLGRDYTGFDIRQEQIDANREQADDICTDHIPTWHCRDSLKMDEVLGDDERFDFIFTCPPYGDLEVYSDLDDDISNMPVDDFITAYRGILAKAAARLEEDRFATIVVGNYRNRGNMVDLSGITVRAMEDAGLKYYNDMVMTTPVSGAAIVCGRVFQATRKVAKVHQYVLNFVKGDPKAATARLGDIELPDLTEIADE